LNSTYGALSGNILIPQTQDPQIVATENARITPSAGMSIACIAPNLTISFLQTPCHIGTLYIVDKFDQLYSTDIESGNFYFASWHVMEVFQGRILVQCEIVEKGSPTGFYTLDWDPTNLVIGFVPVGLSSSRVPAPIKWEHFCVSRGGSCNNLPGGFSFCYWNSLTSITTLYSSYKIDVIIAQNCGYIRNNINLGGPAIELDTMNIAIVQDRSNSYYLRIIIGPPSNGSYSPSLSLNYTSPALRDTYFRVIDTDSWLKIQNSPIIQNTLQNNTLQNNTSQNTSQDTLQDVYFWNGSVGKFVWSNYSSGIRGVVLGPIAHIPAMLPFSLNFQISGIPQIVFSNTNGNSSVFTVESSLSFSINRIACTCGNGVLDDPLKQCDDGSLNNGLPTSSCTQDCYLQNK